MKDEAQTKEGLELLIDDIAGEIDKGYGIVPFVGAGFSVPSGSPMIFDLEDYLQRCICVTLQIDENGDSRRNEFQPWNPRTDQWPPLVHQERALKRGHWEQILFGKILQEGDSASEIRTRLSGAINKASENILASDISTDPASGAYLVDLVAQIKEALNVLIPSHSPAKNEDWRWKKLYGEAIGAMQDWRTALLFLSRIEIPPRTRVPNGEPPVLGSPQPEVIDAFWREVLKGRYPTLGHRMLGALAGALRTDILLTTNFDDLLEKAFETARNPLQVFEVILEGALPQRTDVESHRTLVKLHGGRVSLRADYSLDEPPTALDIDRFVSYLMSAGGRTAFSAHQAKALENPLLDYPKDKFESEKHLLVFGFSGSDRRIVQFVRESISRLDGNFKVYWIAYNAGDDPRKQLKELVDKDRLEFYVCTNLGFLFLELYQRLRNDLPPLGSVFPSAARLTLPPLSWNVGERTSEVEKKRNDFAVLLEAALAPKSWDPPHKIILAYADEHTEGLTGLCSESFRGLESERGIVEIWIDMNDVSSADNLFEVLLEAVYYRIGIEEWTPATSQRAADHDAPYTTPATELRRLLGSVNKRWVIYFNAREKPGANTEEGEKKNRNGWLVENQRPKEESASLGAFVALLKALTKHAPRLTFVVMATGVENDFSNGLWGELQAHLCPLEGFGVPSTSYVKRVVAACISWVESDPSFNLDRSRFLHALVRAQRPRFPAMFWTSAFFPDMEHGTSPIERQKTIGLYLRKLQERGLIRRKPGGMVWVHSVCRKELREWFDKRGFFSGEIHIDLAAWYEKLIDDSESPDAVFEAAYHFCKAAEAVVRGVTGSEHELEHKPDIQRARSLIDAATAQIRSEGYLIQTHGYSRGSCRQLSRLGEIGDKVLLEAKKVAEDRVDPKLLEPIRRAVRRLWLACVETMRAVAREVGEDSKAFKRHRMAAYLHTEPEPTWSGCLAVFKKRAQEDRGWSERMRYGIVKNFRPDRACYWRWLRWTLMLDIETRAYTHAHKILHASEDRSNRSIGIGPLGEQRDYARKRFSSKGPGEPIEFLRLIEQAIQLRLLIFGAHRRIGKAYENELLYADDMIRRGLKLAASVRDHDHSFTGPDASQAIWCEVRLLTHLSVVHARAGEVGYYPRHYRDPLGIISDAEAKLRAANPQRTKAELALIDLYRADAKMNTDSCVALSGWFSEAFSGRMPSTLSLDPKDIRSSAAAAGDAIRFLDRAETVMRERRRNVWWTAWYFERKLRAIACVVLASSPEKKQDEGSPIPYLGLEAAMRLSVTEADRLLDDAIRMVRVDAYRLATVVEAYASCLLALTHRLRQDSRVPRMTRRVEDMENRLFFALKSVREVFAARILESDDLDPSVHDYIQAVMGSGNGDGKIMTALLSSNYISNREAATGVPVRWDDIQAKKSRFDP